MIIVELIGIPGCGKTTTLNAALSLDGQDEREILFLNESFPNPFLLVIKAVVAYFKFFREVRNYCRKWLQIVRKLRGVKIKVKYKIGIFELLQFLYFYDKIVKCYPSNKVLVTDQWIFQHTFSLFHDQNINKDSQERIIQLAQIVNKLFDDNYYVIKCNCATKVIIEHLKNRIDGRSVIDGLQEKEQMRIIEIQQQNLNIVCNLLSTDKLNSIELGVDINILGRQIRNIINNYHG